MFPIDHQGTINGPIPVALMDLFGWHDLGVPVLAAMGEGELAIIGHMIPADITDGA